MNTTKTITVAEVKDVVRRMSEVITENEVYFCELDSAAGDGDFGMSLSKGFREVLARADELDDGDVFRFLRGCSLIISEHCGGASGPLWGSAFGAAASSAKGKDALKLADVAEMFSEAVSAIQKRGGAKLGDKTLLDALIPATEALKDAAERDASMEAAFAGAARAASEGAERTKEMSASKGRAAYVGERSIGDPDAGAVAVATLFERLGART
jgi:dihydroxyacetone kinase